MIEKKNLIRENQKIKIYLRFNQNFECFYYINNNNNISDNSLIIWRKKRHVQCILSSFL